MLFIQKKTRKVFSYQYMISDGYDVNMTYTKKSNITTFLIMKDRILIIKYFIIIKCNNLLFC